MEYPISFLEQILGEKTKKKVYWPSRQTYQERDMACLESDDAISIKIGTRTSAYMASPLESDLNAGGGSGSWYSVVWLAVDGSVSEAISPAPRAPVTSQCRRYCAHFGQHKRCSVLCQPP